MDTDWPVTRSKIKGMFFGVAIGDSLGMPVEGCKYEQILEMYPEGIHTLLPPSTKSWFNGEPAGIPTDDTNFTMAVMRALIEAGGFNMEIQAKHHIRTMAETPKGAGKTTREAIRRLNNGVPWFESGKTSEPRRGGSNGVPMKISPLAAWVVSKQRENVQFPVNQWIIDFSAMTHYTKISAMASVIHTHLLVNCLYGRLFVFKDLRLYVPQEDFLATIDDCFSKHVLALGNEIYATDYDSFFLDQYEGDYKQFKENLDLLWNIHEKPEEWDTKRLAETFNVTPFHIDGSLPLSYACFLKNYDRVDCLYEAVAAGGDTDTNASLVGGLLGALHGIELFEKPENKHLIDGLVVKDELSKLVDEFCDTFNFK